LLPATGAVAAMITRATGVTPYFVGKPNPLMMRSALNTLSAHSETTVVIGDRMDTDVVAGLEAGMDTVLVLSGITSITDVDRFPYRPTAIVDSIAQLPVGRDVRTLDSIPTAAVRPAPAGAPDRTGAHGRSPGPVHTSGSTTRG
ncbi:HAD hydrolase-like protein, partial [Frankia sp. KB5]|uniref:HAD hydrolase-like protein n=1 Tax=Frankia sp. KB5 TaxID=683318 RepID=UPI000A21DFE3